MDTLLNADLQSAIYLFGYNLLIKTGISNQMAHAINSLLLLGLLFMLLYVVDLFIRKLLRSLVVKIVRKIKTIPYAPNSANYCKTNITFNFHGLPKVDQLHS